MASNFNNENEPWKYSLDIDDSDLHLTLVVRSSSSKHVEPSLVTIIPGPSGVVQLLFSKPDCLKKSGTVTGILGDVDNFLKKEKLEQVVGIVKSCSPNMLGYLNATLKDLSGTIPRTIHYKVIGKGGYGKDITVGATMILKNVSVFTHKNAKCG
ncbi:transposase, MuDR, MULE transposase domain protein [Tanacetum coccineum]